MVVTGATGHLGRAVCAALANREVIAASRSGESIGSGRGLTVDLTDDAAVEALEAELGPEVTLVHLAAWHPPATASTTPEDRRRLIETNVLGTMRALDAARRAGIAAVVYASSFEAYGPPRTQVIDEAHRTYPETDYGATKLSGEHHLAAFAYEEGVRTVALRMPAIYGPGERTARALPNFLEAVARGERPTIFGDGADLRDQLHVRDAAQAIVAAIERGEGVYNIADGREHSIAELAQTAIEVADVEGEPAMQPRQKTRRDYHMDIERARRELDFEPSVTLREGMREELAWIREGRP